MNRFVQLLAVATRLNSSMPGNQKAEMGKGAHAKWGGGTFGGYMYKKPVFSY